MLPLGLYNVHCTRPHEEGAWTRGACTRSMLNGLLRQTRGLWQSPNLVLTRRYLCS